MRPGFLLEKEVGGEFANLYSYNQNMAKGLADKLFFLDKLPLNRYKDYEWVFVDFGCADGVLINALTSILEQHDIKATLIGYDISETMIELARARFNESSSPDVKVIFTYEWPEVEKYLAHDAIRVLNLSSVIHEVYSYADSEEDITTFWDRVCNSGFDYVCVRDMMCETSINRATDINLLEEFYTQVENSKPELEPYIKEFEQKWGSLENNKNFVHYLLKYRWITNWKREVNENYFPITTREFLAKMRGFSIVYAQNFRVPFLEDCWKKDFNITIKDPTHVKYIFRCWHNR